MYTSPKLYKVMSVILLVIDCIGALSLIGSGISLSNILGIPGLNTYVPEAVNSLATAISIIFYVIVPVLLFFAYIKFSSVYTFANLIERERREDFTPYRGKGLLNAPASLYQKFGYAIFLIELLVSLVAAVAIIIMSSVATNSFVTVPLIPIICLAIGVFFTYATYYVRYKTFGDILDVAKNKNGELTAMQAENIRKANTGILRGYCVFMFIMCVISVIAAIVGSVLSFVFIAPLFEGAVFFAIYITLGLILSCAMNIADFATTGCFCDNLARMAERLMIKYNLIERHGGTK